MGLKIRRALLTVSDKTKIEELGKALSEAGAELIATGRTAEVLKAAGLTVTPIEKVSGAPEAFGGRMKTLSFPVCSGILYRRENAQDEKDLKELGIRPIDCVVVNFYPFEKAVLKGGVTPEQLTEEIDIGGPTLVRAAAKNAPNVLVLTDPRQYEEVISSLKKDQEFSKRVALECARDAWERVSEYDQAIAKEFGRRSLLALRYGENPHQKGFVEVNEQTSPVGWSQSLTPNELSYNNILDLSGAFELASELKKEFLDHTGVVIVKHGNPCGVSWIPKKEKHSQKTALLHAWEGDPVSSFGGVLVFTDELTEDAAGWLSEKFVELVAAPELKKESASLQILLKKRKKLKALPIFNFDEKETLRSVKIPGAELFQDRDQGLSENWKSVTKKEFPEEWIERAKFGVLVCRSLKSNAIAIVREVPGVERGYQLIGAGQGQPNRVDALRLLAVPRAQNLLRSSGGKMEDCVMVSDAFFPFRDTVDATYASGLRWIVQPGGSLKDQESIDACDEREMGMVLTGVRHFRH
jgi:phosphoribosylaminoimidazolecarboxamide formyltransferase / IMP cyclohydrolase